MAHGSWQPQTDLVAVSICIASSPLRFGPEPGRRGGRHDCRSGGVAAALADSEVWLRDAGGARTPLLRRPSSRLTAGVHFTGSVPPGHYVLCADPVEAPFRFPPRTVTVEPGSEVHTFRLVEGDRPFLRLGAMLVPFSGRSEGIAAVLRAGDLDPIVVTRLREVLRRHGYQPVIDLTRPFLPTDPTDPTGPTAGELVVLEFTPAPDTDSRPSGELVRRAASVAAEAGIAPARFRLGCLVRSPHGPVVVDNEVVLGFALTVDEDTARRHITAAGGRVLEDLSDEDAPAPVLVARFPQADPPTALALTETWLDQGVLHWAEPNVVEHGHAPREYH